MNNVTDIELRDSLDEGYLTLKDLLNDERNPECVAVLDTSTGTVEVFDDGLVKDEERYVTFPTIDDLCPYEETIREYVEKLDFPVEHFSARYLRDNGKLIEFREYRLEKATDKLIEWMKTEGVELKDTKIKQEIVEKTIEGYEQFFTDQELSCLRNSSDNIRILVGTVLHDLANKKMEESEKNMNEKMNIVIELEVDLKNLQINKISINESDVDRVQVMAEENPENTPKYSKKHEEIIAAWELIKERAKKENNIPLLTYHTWLKDLKIVCIQDNTVYVKTPCCVSEEYIKRKFFNCLEEATADMFGEEYQLEFYSKMQGVEKNSNSCGKNSIYYSGDSRHLYR